VKIFINLFKSEYIYEVWRGSLVNPDMSHYSNNDWIKITRFEYILFKALKFLVRKYKK